MAVGDKFAGKSLAITIGGTALDCAQSYRVVPTSRFVEYDCPAAAATQRVFVARSWDASCMDYSDNDSHDKINAWNASAGTTQAVVIYPNGNVSGQTKISFGAFVDAGQELSMGSMGSVPITFTVSGDVTFESATGS